MEMSTDVGCAAAVYAVHGGDSAVGNSVAVLSLVPTADEGHDFGNQCWPYGTHRTRLSPFLMVP